MTSRAGRLRTMKLMVSGMNVPEPMPPITCMARKAFRLGDSGASRLEVNISAMPSSSTRRTPKIAPG